MTKPVRAVMLRIFFPNFPHFLILHSGKTFTTLKPVHHGKHVRTVLFHIHKVNEALSFELKVRQFL